MSGSVRAGFWAGVVAGGIAVSAIYLGLFTSGIPAVALALWEDVMRLIPLRVFSFLIVRLKFAAKPAAFWGMLLVLVLLYGALGALLARWRGAVARALAAWVIVAGALGAIAHRPAAGYLAARISAEGGSTGGGLTVAAAIAGYAALFAVVYAIMMRLFTRRPTPLSAAGEGMTRRDLLSRAVLLALAATAGAGAARWMQTALHTASVAAQSLWTKIRGLPPEMTPNDRFYVVSKNPPGFDPELDAERWTLEVAGMVPTPLKLTYEQVRAMPAVEQHQTLECISNEVGGDLISNAVWKGVRLRDVLQRAGGPSAKALKVAFRCADGYTESIPIVDAMNPTTLLAYQMNGERLPPKHGYPLRLLVPGLFGMKNPKWITRIEVVDYDFQGYWERSGWSDEAVVKTMSKFTTLPRTGSVEEIGLGGVAYAGDRGIQDVELSTDGGKTWRKAEVKPALGPFTWVLWAATWTPSGPGEYTLKVRTRDGGGIMQTPKEAPTLPDGASGYHTLRVRIRK